MNLTELSVLQQRQIEHLFAGACLVNPALALERCAWLDEADLLDEKVRRFWHGLNNGNRGNAIAAAMEAGCYSDILGWSGEVASSQEVETYAEEIQRRKYLIGLDKTLSELMLCRTRNDVEGIRACLSELSSRSPVQREDIPTAEVMHLDFLEHLGEKTSAIRTGVPGLDRAVGGLERQKLVVLAARPSLGKTTIAFQIARNIARDHKVLIFSLEMTAAQLWRKAVCGACGVSWQDVRDGEISPEQEEELRTTSVNLMEVYLDRLRVDDRTRHTTATLWQLVSRYKPDLVVVDVLAKLKDHGENEIRRLANIVSALKDMSKETDSVVVALHHLNRGSEDRAKPQLRDLRDSGNLEQEADMVFFLHSTVDTNQTGKRVPDLIPTQLIIAKDREGKRNSEVNLDYDTKRQWFEPTGGA